jgi:murein DD-endopeptidase MepM/ murein hydrolase activator NlpD
MKKKVITAVFLFLIVSTSDINAIKIGNYDIKHDLAVGYREYSGWYGEKRKTGVHWGIDIRCPEGTPIKYALQGQVYDYGEDDPILIIRT